MLQIDKIFTVFLKYYDDFEIVARVFDMDATNKNEIGIDYSDLLEYPELTGLIIDLFGRSTLQEIKKAFENKELDYITFEYWR